MDDTGSKINELNDGEIAKKWEPVAKVLLQSEKSRKSLIYPEATGVLIEWQGFTYIGGIQEIAPGFSKEIVVLSKSSRPLPIYLADAVRKLDQGRLELEADEKLDLTGRQHVLRRVGSRLMYMTPQQTKYMLLHMPNIYEI